jgi:Dolichyl-phosphate-mannose-protein mannosyltransferase
MQRYVQGGYEASRRQLLERIGAGLEPDWDRLACLLFAALVMLAFLTFRDYGVTWDEDVHFSYGYKVLDFYLSHGLDKSYLGFMNLYTYGAAFDLLTAALARISPIGAWETRHLVDALIGILGIAGTWRIGRFLGGPRAGFLAALLLALTPNYYGHMFNNPKDIPFAAALVWAVYYILRLLPDLPRPPLATVLKLGVVVGLAVGVRVGGLLALCYLGLAIAAALLARRQGLAALLRDGAIVAGRVVLPVLAVGFVLMLFLWPWTQQDPIGHVWSALCEFSHHNFPYKTLFDGNYYLATALPWSYLPVHIVLKLPELILLALAAAPVFAALSLARRRASAERVVAWTIVTVAALFPIVFAVVEGAVLFDGMRHFLFVLPPIAVIAGAALDRMIAIPAAGNWRRLGAASAAAWLTVHLAIMVLLHPDQYVYYNALAGGVPGAAGRYKLDYWAASYREDVNALAAFLRQRDKAAFARTRYRVAVCGPVGPATAYFPQNFDYERDWAKADFFTSFTKDHCDQALHGRPIYRTERLDTTLSVVLDLHPPA